MPTTAAAGNAGTSSNHHQRRRRGPGIGSSDMRISSLNQVEIHRHSIRLLPGIIAPWIDPGRNRAAQSTAGRRRL